MSALARSLAARLLGRPPVLKRGPATRLAVALTFDDGPGPWTAAIAAALERHDCRGTFFVRGAAVDADPEAVVALARAGHEVGNHLWSHADPAQQSRAELRAEIDRTADAVERATGVRPALVRPPYCGAPDRVAAAAAGRAERVVLRSVDPADWRAEGAAEIAERVLDEVGAGDIVCLHDGIAPGNRGSASRAPTVGAVETLVPALLARGLHPVTVTELLG